MFTTKLLTRTVSILSVFVLALSGVNPAFAAPSNDNFADATQITNLPFNVTTNTTGATFEATEPTPGCWFGYPLETVWYAYTPPTSSALTVLLNYPGLVGIYTGNSVDSLGSIGCAPYYYGQFSFIAQAGVTYYFQLSDIYGNETPFPFTLEVTPLPTAGICFGPSDPSVFDNMGFGDCSNDPGNFGFQSFTWNFGDGTTLNTTNCCVNHQYAKDGDYTVQHGVTTVDGRTASTSQVVQVRTKDVAITSFSVPQTARVNQTKTINVSIQNKRYSDYVQVNLYKGLPGGGEQLIGTLTIYVPAKARQATTFKFSYTFTSQDATVGKVTFRADAQIINGRDAFISDNTAIATTLVSR